MASSALYRVTIKQSSMKCAVIFFLPLVMGVMTIQTEPMTVVHKWKSPDFAFPSRAAKDQLIANGSYKPNTGIIFDVDHHGPSGRTFVTMPNFQANFSSVTLAVVTNNRQVDSPLLWPYPDWSWHQSGNCDGLISVFRMKIDKCNRLWVIDAGVTDVFRTFNKTCPPKIMIFDLLSNRLLRKHDIPSSNIQENALFVTIEVETNLYECYDQHAYVADASQQSLLVYSLAKDRSWLVKSSSFGSDPEFYNFTVSNTTFTGQDAIISLTLSPRTRNGDRILFYHSLASNCENYVPSSVLKNESNFVNGRNLAESEFHACFGERSGQSAAEAMDNSGILFSSFLSDNSINCWNWNTPFNQSNNRVLKDDRYLQFPSGMKAVQSWNGDNIWTISCRFQLAVTVGYDRNEYNFHVLKGSAREMALIGGCRERF